MTELSEIVVLNDNDKSITLRIRDKKTQVDTESITIRKGINSIYTKPVVANSGIFVTVGNIGVGKSTIQNFIKNSNIFDNCVNEPVEKFTLLDYYYKEPKIYAYLLQNQILLERFNSITSIKGGSTLIERWLIDDLLIFARNCFDQGNMTEEEYKLHINRNESL